MTRTKMFAWFFTISLGGSAAIAFGFPDVWQGEVRLQKAVSILHMVPVLLAALVLQGPILRQDVLAPLGMKLKPSRWWMTAWLSPLLVLAVGLLVAAALGHELIFDAAGSLARRRHEMPPELLEGFDARAAESPPGSPILLIGPGMLAGVSLNLLLGLATEIGWRGFLFREIQGGFWRRSLLIGLAETLFFLPLVVLGYRFAVPLEGLILMTAWCLIASPILVYIRVRCDSVIPVAAFRGTVLALSAVAADLTTAAPNIRPFFGVGGLVGLMVLLVIYGVHDQFFAKVSLMRKTKRVEG